MTALSPRQLAERLGISERRLRRLLARHGERIPHERSGRLLRFPPEAEAAVAALLTPPSLPALPAPSPDEERRLLTDLIHTQARVMERLAAALEHRPPTPPMAELPPTHDLEARVQALAHELARQGERLHCLEQEVRAALGSLRDEMEKCQFWSKRLMLHLASKGQTS